MSKQVAWNRETKVWHAPPADRLLFIYNLRSMSLQKHSVVSF